MKTILVDAIFCFIQEENERFFIFQEMYRLLEKYPNRKILLTGANDEQMEKWGLNKAPYEVFTLKKNPDKTNPEYYNIMLKNFGFKKDEVIYFEHNPEAVRSAESIGIKSYYYDNDKKDLKKLKEFFDKNL